MTSNLSFVYWKRGWVCYKFALVFPILKQHQRGFCSAFQSKSKASSCVILLLQFSSSKSIDIKLFFLTSGCLLALDIPYCSSVCEIFVLAPQYRLIETFSHQFAIRHVYMTQTRYGFKGAFSGWQFTLPFVNIHNKSCFPSHALLGYSSHSEISGSSMFHIFPFQTWPGLSLS